MIVTPEGLPLSYEVFADHRPDAITLPEILAAVETEHGRAERVWVFDRGLMRDLVRLRRSLRHGQLTDPARLRHRHGRLYERWPQAWRYVKQEVEELRLRWRWDRAALQSAAARDGGYLLRTNSTATDPAQLWQQYIQLTEVEAAFRALKSELALRPIWYWKAERVEAHVMVAFLGYALWVTLKQKLCRVAPSLKNLQRLSVVKDWTHENHPPAVALSSPSEKQISCYEAVSTRL